MKNTVRLLKWVLKACIFFTLFAFALNNQHDASLHLFFGHQWRSPMVLIVLAAFAAGLFVGVLGMAPSRWRHRDTAPAVPATGSGTSSSEMTQPSTPAHGL
ncbi:MAG: LapA family protein [Rhodoferax sp.]|jgi:putative membrane protein|nr:LapA family protein [Rhodoferax sp.]MBP9929647.1 LapA family protein [Rhodoferax sp.]HQZ05906.1 LapA family protein [Burkholderiaceae bacterium]